GPDVGADAVPLDERQDRMGGHAQRPLDHFDAFPFERDVQLFKFQVGDLPAPAAGRVAAALIVSANSPGASSLEWTANLAHGPRGVNEPGAARPALAGNGSGVAARHLPSARLTPTRRANKRRDGPRREVSHAPANAGRAAPASATPSKRIERSWGQRWALKYYQR